MYYLTHSTGGVHITTKRPPRTAIAGEYSSYEDAKKEKEQLERSLLDRKSRDSEVWHNKFDKAFDRQNYDEMNRLTGTNR